MSPKELQTGLKWYLSNGGNRIWQEERQAMEKAQRIADERGYVAPAPGSGDYARWQARLRLEELNRLVEAGDEQGWSRPFTYFGIFMLPGQVNPSPVNFDTAVLFASPWAVRAEVSSNIAYSKSEAEIQARIEQYYPSTAKERGGAFGPYAPPKVTAIGNLNGKTLSEVNQTARSPAQGYHGANRPTLIARHVAAKHAKRPDKEFPNGTLQTAHAEIAVIQRAYDHGLTKGANMVLDVEGRAVCPYCRRDIPAAATEAGLNALIINELSSGKALYWQPGMTKLREYK